MSSVAYLLGEAPVFIEKLPFNFLYLGFVAKAWPDAGILYVRRNPMDACFAMYKQVFTWAYKFSYSLEWLGRYYIAHRKLLQHWRQVLGERLVEVEYGAPVGGTRRTRRANFSSGCRCRLSRHALNSTRTRPPLRLQARYRCVSPSMQGPCIAGNTLRANCSRCASSSKRRASRSSEPDLRTDWRFGPAGGTAARLGIGGPLRRRTDRP